MQAADTPATAPSTSADQGDTPRFHVRLLFDEPLFFSMLRLRLEVEPNVEDIPQTRAKIGYRCVASAELDRVREEFFTTGEGKKVRDIETRVAEAEAAIGKLSIELGKAERDWSAAVAAGADASEPAARRRAIKADLADAKDSLAILKPMLAQAEGEARKRYAVLVRQRVEELNAANSARRRAAREAIGEMISEQWIELARACYEMVDFANTFRGVERRIEKF
jgi:hypothetical protein